MQDVFGIPVVQYLNDLNYLKHKRMYDEEMQKQMMKKHGTTNR